MNDRFTKIILTIGLVLIAFAIVGTIVVMTINKTTLEEVETYTISMEVIEKDYSTYHVKNSGTRTNYILNLRGSGHAIVLEVNEQTYAKYAVGELLEVEVIELESTLSANVEYRIVGLHS